MSDDPKPAHPGDADPHPEGHAGDAETPQESVMSDPGGLERCPFCGGDAYLTESVNGSSMTYIGCAPCGITFKAATVPLGPPGVHGLSRDIKAAWNRRTPSPGPGVRVGWRLVPVEPTGAMVQAMGRAWFAPHATGFYEAYRAALSVAPSPPTPPSLGALREEVARMIDPDGFDDPPRYKDSRWRAHNMALTKAGTIIERVRAALSTGGG